MSLPLLSSRSRVMSSLHIPTTVSRRGHFSPAGGAVASAVRVVYATSGGTLLAATGAGRKMRIRENVAAAGCTSSGRRAALRTWTGQRKLSLAARPGRNRLLLEGCGATFQRLAIMIGAWRTHCSCHRR
jgi:hypothetical protein